MAKVQCYVYDISQGMARMMSMALVGKQVDIIPHTGIVCWGKEYFFGGGPCVAPAGQSVPMQPCQVLDLGVTTKTEAQLNQYLQEITPQFSQENYNLLTHNCNHFADAVAKFLTDGQKGVPREIVDIAQTALSTPQGQQLRGMLEGFDNQMRQNNSGNRLNPFGNVGSQPGSVATQIGTATPSSMGGGVNQESISQLQTAIKEVEGVADMEKRRNCLVTMGKMVGNIANNPTEMKFRKIKMENPAFQKKVAECPGGTECILACGFSPDEVDGVDHWVYSPDAVSIETLKKCVDEINKAAAKCPALPPKPAAPAPTPAATAPIGGGTNPLLNNLGGGFGGGGMPGGMGGMGGMPPNIQQMMQNNPQMAAQAQALMNNPQAMQEMMQNPQVQAMMNNPQMMQNMMNMMNQGR